MEITNEQVEVLAKLRDVLNANFKGSELNGLKIADVVIALDAIAPPPPNGREAALEQAATIMESNGFALVAATIRELKTK